MLLLIYPQVVVSNVGLSCISRDRLLRLAEDGLLYLHSYNAMSLWHQDFVLCQAVAKMVLQVAEQNIELLQHLEVCIETGIYVMC